MYNVIHLIVVKKIIFLFFVLIISCSKKEEEEKKYVQPTFDLSNVKLNCLRWIDRNLYFANQDPFNSSNNNEFHKQKVQSVLKEFERRTKIGEDYFRIKTVSASLLLPKQPIGLKEDEYKSFILIWDDNTFDNYVTANYGSLDNIVDKNALTVINSDFKRKYIIILRASCFQNSDKCDNISDKGLQALILRQIALIFRMSTKDCETNPESIMCVEPSDSQYEDEDDIQFFYDQITSQLINIENNLNFFQDAEEKSGCLNTNWMDKKVYFSAFGTTEKNNTFHKDKVRSALSYIASNTLLGNNYFTFVETNDNLNFFQERQDLNYIAPSWIQIWPDVDVDNLLLSAPYFPDLNAYTQQNRANRDQFTMILRTSCFKNSTNCGDNGLDDRGSSALLARQLGFLVGLNTKNCLIYPNDVMCSISPNNLQWEPESQFIFFNKFNNYLEYIGNIPNFYNYYQDIVEEDL